MRQKYLKPNEQKILLFLYNRTKETSTPNSNPPIALASLRHRLFHDSKYRGGEKASPRFYYAINTLKQAGAIKVLEDSELPIPGVIIDKKKFRKWTYKEDGERFKKFKLIRDKQRTNVRLGELLRLGAVRDKKTRWVVLTPKGFTIAEFLFALQ